MNFILTTTTKVLFSRLGVRRGGAGLLTALLALLLAMVVGGGVVGAAPAAPQVQLSSDAVQITRLVAGAATDPDGAIRLEASVNYRLENAPSGKLFFFLFENDAPSASQSSPRGLPVVRGAGQEVLETLYIPTANTRSVTVLIGLLREDQTLLAWGATNELSLAPWPGRHAFASAMAARLDDDHALAVRELTVAINAGDPAPSYFYWRADSLTALGRYADAIADFTRSIELQPQDRVSRIGRGVAYLWMQEYASAIADLTRAIDETTTTDRPVAWAHRARGIARAALGENDAAISDYQTYLRMTPTVSAADRAEIEGWIAEITLLKSRS